MTKSTPRKARYRRSLSRTSPIRYRMEGKSLSLNRAAISACLNSSRLKTIRRLGLYFPRMTSIAFFPKEPVPPVIRITLSSNTISVLYGFIQFLHLPSQLRTEEDGEVEMYIIVALKPDLKWQDLRNHQMLCLGAFQL